MPKRQRKLPLARAGRPDLTIGDRDWQRLENAYGQHLSDRVRAAVVEATREFVLWEVFERTAEPVAKSQKRIKAIRKAAGDFQNVLLSGRSDAALYAKLLVEKHFEDPRLSDKPDRFYSLSGVLTSLRVACDLALRELEPPASTIGLLGDFGSFPSFKEGEAWDLWIRQITDILKQHGLRTGARKDSDKRHRQSPFVGLVSELQECLPIECKLPYAESALPTAIAQARRKSLRLSSAIRSAKSGSKKPRAEAE